MAIDSVSSGDPLDPDWGNSVADQLNDLPVSMDWGMAGGTTDGSGDLSVTFTTSFSADPVVVVTQQIVSSSDRSVYVHAKTTSGFKVRFIAGGSPDTGASRTVNWVAFAV